MPVGLLCNTFLTSKAGIIIYLLSFRTQSITLLAVFQEKSGDLPRKNVSHQSGNWFVSLSSVNLFVGFTVGTDAALDPFDEPECYASLFLSRVTAQETRETFLSHSSIFFCTVSAAHGIPSSFMSAVGL